MALVSLRSTVVLCAGLVLVFSFFGVPLFAQSLPPFTGPHGSPIPVSAALPGQLPSPSNPMGAPGNGFGFAGSDCIPLSSGMLRAILPRIPNLELGFLYNIGSNLRSGRLYADYLVPFGLGGNSVLFGEAHAECQDFWKRPHLSTVTAPDFTVTHSVSNNRTDLSFGGGYRRLMGNTGFLGVNAFYDSTRLYEKWYSSSGAGLEMVALTPADGAIDLNFNWYGNLINRSELINAFRNQAGSWDIEAGISQPLFDQALDLRLNATAYDFNTGSAVYGWRVGAEVTTRNGFFTLKYEHGHDRVNGAYDTVGGFVNIGFSLEDVLKGESPFTVPEPVFGSPRNLRRLLSQKVRRNWHQPAAVVLSRSNKIGSGTNAPSGCVNPTGPQGPVSVGPGFNNSGGVFVPFPSGCAFTSAYFAGATSVLVDVTVTNPGLSTDVLNGYWSNASATAALPAITVTGKGGPVTFPNVSLSHSSGFLPPGDISGLVFVTTGGSWTVIVSNIRVIP